MVRAESFTQKTVRGFLEAAGYRKVLVSEDVAACACEEEQSIICRETSSRCWLLQSRSAVASVAIHCIHMPPGMLRSVCGCFVTKRISTKEERRVVVLALVFVLVLMILFKRVLPVLVLCIFIIIVCIVIIHDPISRRTNNPSYFTCEESCKECRTECCEECYEEGCEPCCQESWEPCLRG